VQATRAWIARPAARSALAVALALLGCVILLPGCTSSHAASKAKPEKGPLTLSSSAFVQRGLIPLSHSCAGSNASPPLAWHGVAPAGTTSWAIVMTDLDVKPGPWVQWLVTKIPADIRSMASGQLPSRAIASRTSNGTSGFVGVCPPQGRVHRYQFTVYAEGKDVSLARTEAAWKSLQAIKGASVASVSLTGRFAR
jgi:Raf kinase inhibitor-like YbhB/YbcL family protein